MAVLRYICQIWIIAALCMITEEYSRCGELPTSAAQGDLKAKACYFFLNRKDVGNIRWYIYKEETKLDGVVPSVSHALDLCQVSRQLIKYNFSYDETKRYKQFARIQAEKDVQVTMPMPQTAEAVEFIIQNVMSNEHNEVFLGITHDTSTVRGPAPATPAGHLNIVGGATGGCGYVVKNPGDKNVQGLYYLACDRPYKDGREHEGAKAVVCEFAMPAPCVMVPRHFCESKAEKEGKVCNLYEQQVITQQAHPLAVKCAPTPKSLKGTCPRERWGECRCEWESWTTFEECTEDTPCSIDVKWTRAQKQPGIGFADYSCRPEDGIEYAPCEPCKSSPIELSNWVQAIAIVCITVIQMTM